MQFRFYLLFLLFFSINKTSAGDPVRNFVTPNMSPIDVERIRKSLGSINQFICSIFYG